MDKKRVAICFYGQTRTFQVINNIFKKLKDDNIEFDFFVSTWDDFQDKSQFDFCKEKEFIDPNIREFINNTERAAYSIHRVNILKSQTELNESFLYDYIMWTRTEVFYDIGSLKKFFNEKINSSLNFEINTSTGLEQAKNGMLTLPSDFFFAGKTETFDIYATGWKSFFKRTPPLDARHSGHSYHGYIIKKNSNLFNHKVYPINYRIDVDFIRGPQTDIKSYREIS